MEVAKVIAENLQNLLDDRKISVTELANHLEVSRQTMTNYLKAVSVIDIQKLDSIAKYINVPVEQLLTKRNCDNRPELIFRTALNYKESINEIQDLILKYLSCYEDLARLISKNISYFPEQYNLSLTYQDKVIDINYECQNYFDPKLKIDENLDWELARLAEEQRRLLGLGDNGAISLISALTARGVNVIFLDMSSSEISGLSICDETHGCYIFVNTNDAITVERQLFTVAHEYAHILLHRPVYKRKLRQSSENGEKKNLLDDMADCFAGHLLCPKSILSAYESLFQSVRNDLSGVYRIAVSLKLQLQISLQSLLMGLKKYGYISNAVVSEYYKIIKSDNSDRNEPRSIKNDPILGESFNREKNSGIQSMLQKAHYQGKLNEGKGEDIKTYFYCLSDELKNVIEKWSKEQIDIAEELNAL